MPITPPTPALGPTGSFIDNFVAMADNFGAWLSHPLSSGGSLVSMADDAGAAIVTSPQIPVEMGTQIGVVVGDASDYIAKKADEAATAVINPIVIYGGLGLLAFLVLRPRKR